MSQSSGTTTDKYLTCATSEVLAFDIRSRIGVSYMIGGGHNGDTLPSQSKQGIPTSTRLLVELTSVLEHYGTLDLESLDQAKRRPDRDP